MVVLERVDPLQSERIDKINGIKSLQDSNILHMSLTQTRSKFQDLHISQSGTLPLVRIRSASVRASGQQTRAGFRADEGQQFAAVVPL